MKTAILIFMVFLSQFAFADVASMVKENLPNAVSIDISSNRTVVRLKDREALVTNNKSSGGLLGSITLTAIPKESEMGFYLKWVPVFTFAFHRLTFDTPSVFLRETDFQVFRTSLGYGPEINYKTTAGTFFANISAGVAYSWVSWSSPVSGGSMGKSNLNIAMTLGYYQKLSERFVLKFFIQDIAEDDQVWKEALDSSQGFPVPVKGVTNSIAGLSLAWIF